MCVFANLGYIRPSGRREQILCAERGYKTRHARQKIKDKTKLLRLDESEE